MGCGTSIPQRLGKAFLFLSTLARCLFTLTSCEVAGRRYSVVQAGADTTGIISFILPAPPIRMRVLNSSTKTARAKLDWRTIKGGAGMASSGIWRWSCSPIASCGGSGTRPTRRRIVPPSAPHSFPAVHRQVLGWLFHDLIVWFIASDHSKQVRPRRNYRGSTRAACR